MLIFIFQLIGSFTFLLPLLFVGLVALDNNGNPFIILDNPMVILDSISNHYIITVWYVLGAFYTAFKYAMLNYELRLAQKIRDKYVYEH